MHQLTTVVLPASLSGGSAPAWVSSDTILGLLLFAALILGVFTGLVIMAKARHGDMKKAGAAGAVTLIGAAIIAMSVGGVIWVVAEGGIDVLFNG